MKVNEPMAEKQYGCQSETYKHQLVYSVMQVFVMLAAAAAVLVMMMNMALTVAAVPGVVMLMFVFVFIVHAFLLQ